MYELSIDTYIWPWPILKVRIKVVHISTVNILKMVTDMETLPLPRIIKSCEDFRLAYLCLILTCSKSQGQGHSYFGS